MYVKEKEDMFLWGEDIAHKFWNKYRKDLVITLPAKKHSAEVIKKLKNEGNEIYIITARRKYVKIDNIKRCSILVKST